MQELYIVLIRSGTILSKCIGLYTKSKYNHTAISLDDTLTQMYSFARKSPRNPFNAGFIIESKESEFYRIFKNSECKILKISIPDYKYNAIRKEINRFILTQDKYGYNLFGFVGFFRNKPIKRKDKYFCSQFVSLVLNKGGIRTMNCPELTKPMDFEKFENIEIIYEGPIRDYDNKNSRELVTNCG